MGDNITWPRITLQKTHWFRLRLYPGPWASYDTWQTSKCWKEEFQDSNSSSTKACVIGRRQTRRPNWRRTRGWEKDISSPKKTCNFFWIFWHWPEKAKSDNILNLFPKLGDQIELIPGFMRHTFRLPTSRILGGKIPAESLQNISELGYAEQCHNHCFNFKCFRLHHYFIDKKLRSSSIQTKKLQKYLRSSSIFKNLRLFSISQKNVGRLPFPKQIKVVFH